MTHTQTEQCIVSSLLSHPHAVPGPAVATALAYSPDYWESPEAAKLAEAIRAVVNGGKVASRAMVKAHLADEYKPWVDHFAFSEVMSLPMEIVELEVRDLLAHYANKRLISVVGRAYERMVAKPNTAMALAMDLRLQLEGKT